MNAIGSRDSDGLASIPGKYKIFPFSIASMPALGPIQSMQWVPRALSLGVKQPGREADHSSPSSTGVKNGGAIPPLCLPSWRGV
jgi:hypothetical protein